VISAPGPIELLFILGLALLVLGPTRLPDAARSIGRGVRELREALQGRDEDDDYEELDDYPEDEDERETEDDDADPEADEEPAETAAKDELPERS
jgi:sec-independent protein translocase protein TatA